jgi:hypothetical protein
MFTDAGSASDMSAAPTAPGAVVAHAAASVQPATHRTIRMINDPTAFAYNDAALVKININ